MKTLLALFLLLSPLWCVASVAPPRAPAFDVARSGGQGDPLAIQTVVSDQAPSVQGPSSPPPDQAAWQPRPLRTRTIGFEYRGVWARTTLTNSGDQARLGWIVVAEAFSDYVDCFVSPAGQPSQVYRLGDQRPFDARPLHFPGLLIPVTVAAHAQTRVHCLIRNNGSEAATFQYWTPEQYTAMEREASFSRALCYGALAFTLVVASLLSVVDRNALAVLMVAELLPVLAATAGWEGDAYQLLWPHSPQFNMPPYSWILIGFIVASVVFRRIIMLSQTERWFVKLVTWSAALLLLAVTAFPMQAPALSALVQWLAVVYPLVMILICANHWQDNAVVRLLLAGKVVQLVGLFFNVAGVFGLYHGMFALASLYASVAKAFLLASALFYRMRIDRIERAAALAEHNHELTQRLDFEARLRHAVSHHPRYGMPNQAMLEEAIRSVAEHAHEGLSVWIIKLNRFGFLESILPPDALSDVVKVYAHELSQWFAERPNVHLLSIEGEHSLVALDDSTLAFVSMGTDTEALSGDLVFFLTRRFAWQGLFVAWDPYIGVATLCRTRLDEASSYVDEARIALQWCTGHSRVRVFDAERMKREQLAYGLTLDLEGAIERGELLLHFQPKVTLQSRRTESLEALVRWQHPERGMIPPGAFIAEAEATGAINRLTMWAIAEAARFLLTLPDQGVRVAVNITAFDLATPHFVDKVIDTLAQAHCPPQRLILEVTESAALSDPERATQILSSLRAAGIRIALDDFGTGYSSLGILQEMPLDELKVDRSFVTNMAEFGRKQAVLAAMIDVGHRLGLTVTIEGVEREDSLDWLARHGCDVVQGFVFSRPLDAEATRRWLMQAGLIQSPAMLSARPLPTAHAVPVAAADPL